MPSGLVALLDDVAAIAKLAASSLDDVAAAAGKASTKAAGVVIDDTAVSPQYVTGFTPDRELPIIGRIALGSLKNKLVFLLPAALLLSQFLPVLITPLLMIGGAYLCFEGAEKVLDALNPNDDALDDVPAGAIDAEHEKKMVSGAIRTDFILSAEIMAIALAEVASEPLLTRGIILAVVGIAVTVGVYGVVALIVKMDDIGLHLAKGKAAGLRALGRGMVKFMPMLLRFLSVVGTAAMLWVGGQIILHGIEEFGVHGLPGFVHHAAEAAGHAVPAIGGAVEWLIAAALAGVFGTLIGGAIAWTLHKLPIGKTH